MTVSTRRYVRHGVASKKLLCDIRIELPNGEVFRERVVNPTSGGRTAAKSWAEEREHAVLTLSKQGLDLAAIWLRLRGGDQVKAPTLAEFWPEFVKGHCEANHEKFSSKRARESVYKHHLEPRWGALPLSKITDEEVAKLKGDLSNRAPKTVNNVLVCLSVVLKVAHEWKRISAMPCRIRLVKVLKNRKPEFYDEDQLSRLVAAASSRTSDLVTVLLGADAGLRRGEVIGLEWGDLDLVRGTLTVRRAVYRGVVGTPKGNAERTVDLTVRLRAALKAHKPADVVALKSQKPLDANARVLVGASDESIRSTMERLSRRAGLPAGTRMKRGKEVPRWLGLYHKLRHTFGTRLAMAGVPPRTIQALMGHVSISTSERYMHVVKDAPAEAIRALDRTAVGGRLAAESGAAENVKEDAK